MIPCRHPPCEYPIHPRSSRRLFIASSIAAGPLYKPPSTSTLYQYFSCSHTGLPYKEDSTSPCLGRNCRILLLIRNAESSLFQTSLPLSSHPSVLPNYTSSLSNNTHQPYQSLAMHFQSDFQSRAIYSGVEYFLFWIWSHESNCELANRGKNEVFRSTREHIIIILNEKSTSKAVAKPNRHRRDALPPISSGKRAELEYSSTEGGWHAKWRR